MQEAVQNSESMADVAQTNSTFNQTETAKTAHEDAHWDQATRVFTTTIAVYAVLCETSVPPTEVQPAPTLDDANVAHLWNEP